MILKKVYISRGRGVKANLETVYILIFFFMMASLRTCLEISFDLLKIQLKLRSIV